MSLRAIAASVREGRTTARAGIEAALERIAAADGTLNCFTAVLVERALRRADVVDAAVAAGKDPGPLAGVPFAVKNLFDVAGIVTLAGSRILADRPPAAADAPAIAALERAGAILVGTLNMDEFAYGFSTENEHYGPTRNPHDPARIAGGSSGGSAAAVAASLVPLTLGSDTNGSVRVPAALCGVFGLKPTFGKLDRTGLFPFVDDLDHVGLFTRSSADLELAYAVLSGEAIATATGDTLPRAAILGGWFAQPTGEGVAEAVSRVAAALGNPDRVDLPASDVARSAAFCITAAQAGGLHRERLTQRPMDFDGATRDRLLAGLLLPAAATDRAQRFRHWYREQARALFEHYDILIAPATICSAPRIGEGSVMIGGREVPVRANLGLFTQPLSFIGLPVVCAPVAGCEPMPLGVQIVAAPGREDLALRMAGWLERCGVIRSTPLPAPQGEYA